MCKSVKTKLKVRNKAQEDPQNLLLTFTEADKILVKEVFPIMAVDSISLIYKNRFVNKNYLDQDT